MLIELKNLSGGYGGKNIVSDISFGAHSGEILCIVGPNGCGKTTLFRLILGFLKKTQGSVCIEGRDASTLSPAQLAKRIAYIPQSHTPIFSYTALDVVIMGRASHFSAFESPKPVDRQSAFDALERLDALHLANRNYATLSGGQRQIVLIARAICQQAKVFVMDEPSASLDFANQFMLIQVISDLAAKGYCVIMSTHSPEHSFSVGQKVLLMHNGRIAAFGKPSDVVSPELLKQIYGIEMDIVNVLDRHGKCRSICIPVSVS